MFPPLCIKRLGFGTRAHRVPAAGWYISLLPEPQLLPLSHELIALGVGGQGAVRLTL